MRRLDWFFAAVIGAFLVFVAAQALSQATVDMAGGVSDVRQSFAQRLESPPGDPISVQCPTLLRRR